MNRKLYMPLLMASAVAFTSCNKKMGELDANFFNVSPMPLVTIGGDVPTTINGSFPEKFFEKKSTLTITPVLVYEGGEVKGTPFTYQGEKVEGNYQQISYDEGGNITMKTEFDYIPEMRKSELYLSFSADNGKKSYELPRVKVADGVIATAEIANAAGVTPAMAADQFKRVTVENVVAKILFNIQQSYVSSSQLNSVEMKEVKAAMKTAEAAENQSVKNINITSTASPDGELDLNERLAQSREKNTMTQINRVIKQDKLNTEVFAEFTAEDWAGFQELVQNSNIQDKELILRVLSMYNDPQEREQEIKNISAAFTQIADEILPQLRYSKVTAAIETIGKSDAEITTLAKNEPKALNLEELLYSATLTDNKEEKLAIYQDATEIFPNDFRAFNNIGRIYFEAGELEKAKGMFNKAKSVNPTSAEVAMNLGMIALANEDLATAEQLLGNAAGVEELAGALGTLYTQKGEYQKAVEAFGSTQTNNAAVAQICAGQYSDAKRTLDSVEADATTFYLKAIIDARQNNASGVITNLKECVKRDRSMVKTILSDIEFIKFGVEKLLN